MNFFLLAMGLLGIALAFEQSKRAGAALLLVLVLGMLLTAQKKGYI